MSEKKKNIENGQDIIIDDVTVLNGISVAEKTEEKKEETSVEVSEVKPEEVPSVEVSEESEEKKEEPFADVDGSIISAPTIELPTEVPVSPEFNFTPEIQSMDNETSGFNVSTNANLDTSEYEPQLFNANNDVPTWQNDTYSSFGTQNSFGEQDLVKTELPDGVKAAVNMIENEAIELATEIKKLKLKNTELESSNNDLRAQVSELQAQNQILRNEKASIQNSMANVQSRILDVFGASMNNSSMIQNESSVVKFPQSSFNDDQKNNFGGMQNVA